jgi:hypothetical protein
MKQKLYTNLRRCDTAVVLLPQFSASFFLCGNNRKKNHYQTIARNHKMKDRYSLPFLEEKDTPFC